MGADTSIPLAPVSPNFPMASITFRDDDRMTVIHLDGAGLSVIAQAIQDTWKEGIQAEQSRCGTGWSFKLSGNPFWTINFKSSLQVRQMVLEILRRLHGIGYRVLASGTLGINKDRSTLFFRKMPLNIPNPQFLCISFSGCDKILFTNLPSELTNLIVDTIVRFWPLGIQNKEEKDGVLQIKLAGRPWSANNNKQSIMAKVLLQEIFGTLYRYHWFYHINVNLNGHEDCLIFRYDAEVGTNEVPEFCSIIFSCGDRLRLINPSDEIIAMIQRTIETNWMGKIQDAKEFHRSWEFKISGNPWSSVKEESARARYLMLKIFQEMLQRGWHNVAGFYLDRDSSERVVLLFQKREPMNRPMFCIAPFDDDKFWLINMPRELVTFFINILCSRWPKGVISEQELALNFGTVHKLMLKGCPWVGGESNSPIHARSFFCNIIDEFSKLGWELMLCADVTSRIVGAEDRPDYPLDVYSFWFAYNPTHNLPQPSAPTFQVNTPTYPQYGVGAAAYPPSAHMQGYSTAQGGPPLNDPPPSYSEATGWTPLDEKR